MRQSESEKIPSEGLEVEGAAPGLLCVCVCVCVLWVANGGRKCEHIVGMCESGTSECVEELFCAL